MVHHILHFTDSIVVSDGHGTNLITEHDTTDLVLAALAPNTRAVYRSVITTLERWQRAQGYGMIDDPTLAFYLQHRFDTGASPATLHMIRAAIQWFHKTTSTPDPVGLRTKALLKIITREGRDGGDGNRRRPAPMTMR